MDFQSTRHLVLDFMRKVYLKDNGNIQLPSLSNQLITFVRENRTGAEQILNELDGEDLLDIINSFMHEGILRWGKNMDNPDIPFIGVTKYGRKVLESDEPIPYDPMVI